MTEFIPCEHCGNPTDHLGRELCDRCWSVDRRVRLHPKIALKVLDEMGLTPTSEAEELLEWLNKNPNYSLLWHPKRQWTVVAAVWAANIRATIAEGPTPLDALLGAREAMKDEN